MANILHWLVPKEGKLFEMLAEQSENCLEGAKELDGFVNEYEKLERKERKSRTHALKNIELKGDEIEHKLIERLDKASATPIDKECMYRMAALLDDLTDLINSIGARFVILGIERIDEHTLKLVSIIRKAAEEINKSILEIRKPKHMNEHCTKIHSLENEADELYDEAMSELFHFYKNSIDIIKYKEIYELLGNTAGKCGDIADAMKSIVIKHA